MSEWMNQAALLMNVWRNDSILYEEYKCSDQTLVDAVFADSFFFQNGDTNSNSVAFVVVVVVLVLLLVVLLMLVVVILFSCEMDWKKRGNRVNSAISQKLKAGKHKPQRAEVSITVSYGALWQTSGICIYSMTRLTRGKCISW